MAARAQKEEMMIQAVQLHGINMLVQNLWKHLIPFLIRIALYEKPNAD